MKLTLTTAAAAAVAKNNNNKQTNKSSFRQFYYTQYTYVQFDGINYHEMEMEIAMAMKFIC